MAEELNKPCVSKNLVFLWNCQDLLYPIIVVLYFQLNNYCTVTDPCLTQYAVMPKTNVSSTLQITIN